MLADQELTDLGFHPHFGNYSMRGYMGHMSYTVSETSTRRIIGVYKFC